MSLQQLFEKMALLGAEWILWLLLVLSVISIAVMVERAIYFRKLRVDLTALTEKVRGLLRNKDHAGALQYLQQEQGVEAAVARYGVAEADRGANAAEEAMVGARVRYRLTLERYLTYLGTIGNNAPFIGLLGTVIGIIKAFHTLSISKNPEMKIIMADIAEALVATGVGLLVAIPAVVGHNYFQRRVRAVMSNAETLSHMVLAFLKGEDTTDTSKASEGE